MLNIMKMFRGLQKAEIHPTLTTLPVIPLQISKQKAPGLFLYNPVLEDMLHLEDWLQSLHL